MKVSQLRALLSSYEDDADVLVRIDGSILPTDNAEEHEDYNADTGVREVFILARENWEQ